MVLTHAPFARLDIPLQETVDHVVKLHETLVFAQIILWLAENIVDLPVRAPDADFAGLLEGC